MKNKTLLTLLAIAIAHNASAQTGTEYLKAYKKADCTVPFDVNAEGETFRVKWGMDTAWDWDYNVNRGIAHYGKGNFETGRVSFQPIDIPTENADGTFTLSSRQRTKLDWRIKLILSTGTKEINLNCDHEVLFRDVDANGNCYDKKDANGNVIPNYTGKTNYVGKPENWVKLIKATAQYCEAKGLKVVSVSPFNESDFTGWQQYNGAETNGMKDFLAIAKLIKADPYFDNIRVCGGNTLNCDRALPWYNALKEYLDEGNTHQLAGSFDTYANFFSTVKADGKVVTGDELHNVGEAIVGVQYGMETGIWWGFDAKARGQFMHDSNEGVRLGYGEDRPHWTSAAIYRNDSTKEVHGYIGSSERQANTSSYQFVSKGKDVFFNGYGPTRHWTYEIPGGTGYQKGQINAEKLFDITWGEDVAPLPEVNGTYQIVNASSNKMMTYMNGNNNVQSVTRKTSGTTQQWNVYPSYTDGDCSYWFIDNAGNADAHLNLRNMNLNDGAQVMTYNAGHGHEEQWYIKYAQDGYYYIIARLSNKYLYCSNTTSGTAITTRTAPDKSITPTMHKRYLWRFQPIDSKSDNKATDAPTGLKTTAQSGSIRLDWNAVEDETPVKYNILRADESGEWNTIGRNDTLNTFLDNTALKGHSYTYKVVAVDYAGNRSVASETVEGKTLDAKRMLMQLQFDKTIKDNTANHNDAVIVGDEKYSTTATLKRSGTASLNINSGTTRNTHLMIPNSVANNDEMTIAMWVRWGGSSNWERIFDFGSGTDQYMFLTPSNGSEMRFVMKNGGDEQVLSTGKKLASTSWKHIAITLKPISGGKMAVKLYTDGVETAADSSFTIKPSDIDPSLCYLGRSMFDSDPLFKGALDDIRIYNHALNAEQIKAVMEDLGEVSQYIDTEVPGGDEADVVTIDDITSLIDAYLQDGTTVTIDDITALIARYLEQ